MAEARWQALQVGDVEPIAVAGVSWRPLRRTLGIRAFGVNAYSGSAGEDVVERHTEETLGHEEMYVVLTGCATFTLDDEVVDAPAGTVVFVRDPTVQRHARAEQDGTTVLAVGAPPGASYEPSAWESYFAVERFRPTGEYAAALAELDEAAAEHPDHPGVEYSLACWHALAGDEEAALAHVNRAIELDPRFAAWARQDDDLVAIRDRLPAED